MPRTLLRTDPVAVRPSAAPPFTCTWSDGGFGAAWVRPVGEVDLAVSPELERTLGEAQQSARLVVLDLRRVDFMDTTGVHVIVDASARARREGRRLIVVRDNAQRTAVLTLTGASEDVEIFDLDPASPPVEVLLQLAGRDRRAG